MCERIFQLDDSDQKIYDFCHLYTATNSEGTSYSEFF